MRLLLRNLSRTWLIWTNWMSNLPMSPREILLHGHCHQKALVGTTSSHRILSLPPNYTVKEVDSGCCGMAGFIRFMRRSITIFRSRWQNGDCSRLCARPQRRPLLLPQGLAVVSRLSTAPSGKCCIQRRFCVTRYNNID